MSSWDEEIDMPKRGRRIVVNFCKGCGKETDCVYCSACSKTIKCAHGAVISSGCDKCDFEGDLAFDISRERR
jgi:hypothetical protein